jgi:hypothetical protein
VEAVIQPGAATSFSNKYVDLNRLVMTGGRERTDAEYLNAQPAWKQHRIRDLSVSEQSKLAVFVSQTRHAFESWSWFKGL